jgi:1,4-alpha-glucan branching enzyme
MPVKKKPAPKLSNDRPYPAGEIRRGRTADAPVVHAGMGAIPHAKGVAFRVWAPHAEGVSVVGTFNEWDAARNPMTRENDAGYWYGDVPGAKFGDEYRFALKTPWGELSRIDPYAREVTNSVGNGVVHDPHFDWGEPYLKTPAWNEWVIYELHVGTFNDPTPHDDKPATFADVVKRFDHLKKLGVNCLQVMPVAEFAGDRSWGYNPAHIFAVESAYGGPRAFKEFVREAHRNGFAVILDVVYNHFGPSDLDLWRFDGWSENDAGGIYFYQDWRKETPWGDTRPDYGRAEVRQFIRDNALMWVEDYHVDGLRMDMTLYIRSVRADGEPNLPDGWTLLQWVNGEIREKHPNTLTVAEDLQHNDWMTKPVGAGGAGYGAQWDDQFVHPIRAAVIAASDEHRSMGAVATALQHRYNGDAFQRVIYSESHDEVANGRARVVHEIAPNDPNNWFAQKRSTLAAALVFTAPGIPMLFQGQEFLEGEWFRDTVPVDWDKSTEFRGIVRLYRDLIRLRLDRDGDTRGLCGQHIRIIRADEQAKVLAFHRWLSGGPGDDVVVVANFHREPREKYTLGFPAAGAWKLRINSDWKGYSTLFGDHPSADVTARPGECDGLPNHASVSVGPYTVLVFARTRS